MKFTTAGALAVTALGAAAATIAFVARAVFVVADDTGDGQEVRRVVFAADRSNEQAEVVELLDCADREGGADDGALHRIRAFQFHRTAEVFRFHVSTIRKRLRSWKNYFQKSFRAVSGAAIYDFADLVFDVHIFVSG